jgi:hypothetical protein
MSAQSEAKAQAWFAGAPADTVTVTLPAVIRLLSDYGDHVRKETIEACARECETRGLRGCDKDNVSCHKIDAEAIRMMERSA